MKPSSASGLAVPRRKPRQSRAHQTSWALQEAFVRLLTESDYDAISIRRIVDLAGTGLGSFYEYFANKDDLARVCVHLRTKALLKTVRDARIASAGASLEDAVRAMIDHLLAAHADHPSHWGAHYLLERRFSGLSAYAAMYERFVQEWECLIGQCAIARTSASNDVARTCHTITYGMFAHAHMHHLHRLHEPLDQDELRRQSTLVLLNYLRKIPL